MKIKNSDIILNDNGSKYVVLDFYEEKGYNNNKAILMEIESTKDEPTFVSCSSLMQFENGNYAWGQGHYFGNMEDAMDKFKSLSPNSQDISLKQGDIYRINNEYVKVLNIVEQDNNVAYSNALLLKSPTLEFDYTNSKFVVASEISNNNGLDYNEVFSIECVEENSKRIAIEEWKKSFLNEYIYDWQKVILHALDICQNDLELDLNKPLRNRILNQMLEWNHSSQYYNSDKASNLAKLINYLITIDEENEVKVYDDKLIITTIFDQYVSTIDDVVDYISELNLEDMSQQEVADKLMKKIKENNILVKDDKSIEVFEI